jgi:hypothetical protein
MREMTDEIKKKVVESPVVEDSEDKQISLFCRINLKLEAYVYSLFALILYIPVVGISKFVKGIIWVILHLPQIIEWVVERILLPLFTAVWLLIVGIAKLVVLLLRYSIRALRFVIRAIIKFLLWINWCAVRSLIRAISAITGIGSSIYIINAFRYHATNVIFTGYFHDSNPEIQNVHIAIALLMISITMYYNAWAFSKSEERKFVCKNTWGSKKLRDGIESFWK